MTSSFTERDPTTAEPNESLLSVIFHLAVILIDASIVNLALNELTLGSMLFGMPTSVPTLKGYLLLSRGAAV